MQARLEQWKQYLLTGVSHVIPFIASGGILIALAISLAPMHQHVAARDVDFVFQRQRHRLAGGGAAERVAQLRRPPGGDGRRAAASGQ
ncbi:hypothetical protein ABI924_19480, partial [Chromobacterium phragmitis]